MSKITVYRSSPYVVEKKSAEASIEKKVSISFEELRSWIRSGKIFSQLFRYRDSLMVTYDLTLISKPFASALLMRFLARNSCIRMDRKGNSQNLTFPFIFSLFYKLGKNFCARGNFLKRIQKHVAYLSHSIRSKENKQLDLAYPPLYLRTDFSFGLMSGGSVGHIAGVLNNLSHFTGKPIFLTSDQIPTVRSDWESHLITPGDEFWDFSEIPPLHFNEVFFERSKAIMSGRKPSFIYQRYSINNFSGVELAQYFQVPFVLEFNGSEIWVNRHWGNHVLKYEKLAEEIELLNLKSSDLIVVVSQPLKDQLSAIGIDPEKILVNPNGVDTDIYSPDIDGSEIREKYHLENKIVLGFIGTFGKWHGAEVLAEAFRLLLQKFPELKNSVRLLLIGDGLTLPAVKKVLSKWKLDEYVVVTGTVPQESGPKYLAASDVLVAPHVPNADGSPFFGSPTKLFEYMAMGKGIVASDLDQIGEILKHEHSAWMVEPGNAESLMEGLKTLIDDPSLRIRLGLAARNEATSLHTWKEHTRKIIDKLREKYPQTKIHPV